MNAEDRRHLSQHCTTLGEISNRLANLMDAFSKVGLDGAAEKIDEIRIDLLNARDKAKYLAQK